MRLRHFSVASFTILCSFTLYSCVYSRSSQNESRNKESELANTKETSGSFSSSIEIELEVASDPYFFLRLTRTSDDTVLGLLNGIETYATTFQAGRKTEGEWKDLFKEEIKKLGIAAETKWSTLQAKKRLEAINALTALLRPDYDSGGRDGRKIPGLLFLDTFDDLVFKETTSIGSLSFPEGAKGFPLSEFLAEKSIEYASPRDVKNANLRTVEFQLRDRKPLLAGDSLKMAYEFLRILVLPKTSPRTHHHIHAVFNWKKPLEKETFGSLIKYPLTATALSKLEFTEYYRRLNLFMDAYVPVIEKTNIVTKAPMFDYLKPEHLKEFYRFLGQDPTKPAPFFRLFASVAFQPTGKYDSPELAGFEFRNFSSDPNRAELVARILNSLHIQLVEAKLPIDSSSLSAWLVQGFPALTEGHYADKLAAMVPVGAKTSSEFKSLATSQKILGGGPDAKLLSKAIENFCNETADSYFEEHQELKFLTHDWASDPIVFRRSDFEPAKMQELRLKALKELAAAPRGLPTSAPTSPIVADFLVKSGIFDRIAKSLFLAYVSEAIRP